MRWLPLGLIPLVALVACSHKDAQSSTKAQADSLTGALARLGDTLRLHNKPSGHQYGPPTGKIRVANLLELNGQPGGPVDLYDRGRPDSDDVPLIKNLAFGQVSDYVSPRGADNYAGSPSNLYVFPAGSKQASSPYGNRIDNVGFAATDQITVALGPTNFAGGAGMALPALEEAGQRLNANRDSLRTIPSGQGLLVLLQADMNADSLPELYLMVDGTCPLTTSFPKNTHPTGAGTDVNFGVTPGTHTIGIVTAPRGQGLLNCNGKKPGQTSTVTVTAGQRYVVFVYGVPSDGFKATSAPIPGP